MIFPNQLLCRIAKGVRLRAQRLTLAMTPIAIITAAMLLGPVTLWAQEGSPQFTEGLSDAFKKSRWLSGLDLSDLERKGQIRILNVPGKQALQFFHLSDANEDRRTSSETSNAQTQPVSNDRNLATKGSEEARLNEENSNKSATAISSGTQPPPKPVPVVNVTEQSLALLKSSSEGETATTNSTSNKQPAIPVVSGETDKVINPDVSVSAEPVAFKGSYHFVYEMEKLKLSAFKPKNLKGAASGLILDDAVLLFSSKKRKVKLSDLPLSRRMQRYLKKFITTRRRVIELPEGGLLFARVSFKNNSYLTSLDKSLGFKDDSYLVQGDVSGRLLGRLLNLNSGNKGPAGVILKDLSLKTNFGGFRPPKIGRYIDGSDVEIAIRGTENGHLAMTAETTARFGIGARKVKVPAKLTFKPDVSVGGNSFELTAKAGKKELRNVKIQGNPLAELDFLFALDDTFKPRLRASGHATKGTQRISVAGELDEEDGKDLFTLDGSTLEAIAGLDIPGFDEIKLPEIPNLNTSRAVSVDTIIRDQPAKIVIGPVSNNQATYIALAMEGGGIENLVPLASLGNMGKTESGYSVFLYVPKGRAPPKLSNLPSDLSKLFLTSFTQNDLGRAKTGMNLFQSTTFSASHPFSKGLSLLRGGQATPETVKIVGRIDPLIFDEPDESVKELWSEKEAKARLKKIVSTLSLRGTVSGLEGIGLGTLFKLSDTAELNFNGTKSGKVTAGLTFGGEIKLRGAKSARLFEFDTQFGESGSFVWQGDEVDAEGEDIKGGQQIKLSGLIKNRRPENLNLAIKGSFRLGDLFATQIKSASDLKVRDITLSNSEITGTLDSGSGNASVYIASKPGKRLAVVVLNGVKPGAYLPGLSTSPFADLALPDSLLMIADDGVDRDAIQALSKSVSEPLLAILDKEGIEPQGGVSFLSRINFKGNDPLSRLAVRLGVAKSETAILFGKVPASVLARIAKKSGASSSNTRDLTGFELTAKFPPVSVPGLSQVFDLNKQTDLNIIGTREGVLDVHLTSSGLFTIPIINRKEPVDVKIGLNGAGSKRQVVLDVVTGSEAGDPSKRMKLKAISSFDTKSLKAVKDFVVTIEDGMTVADILGQDVPGLGDLRLAEAKLSLNHIKGVLALGQTKFSANLVSIEGSRARLLTLEAADLPGLSVIPGLSNTKLKDIKLRDLLITYIVGGGNKNEGFALPLAQLPQAVAHLKSKLTLPSGSGPSFIPSGVNLASFIDPSKLGPLSDVLKRLGAGGGNSGSFKLSAQMPGEALVFLREKLSSLKLKKSDKKSTLKPKLKKLAAKAVQTLIKKTKVSIPIPAISLPGIGQYVSTRSSIINVNGFEDPQTKVAGLKTTISSSMEFSVPGTPTTGDFESVLTLSADGSKNISATLLGTGNLKNAEASVVVQASLARTGTKPDLRINLTGEKLSLGQLTGLTIPGVSELSLKKAVIQPGSLSGEIELKGATTKVAAFDFGKSKRPIVALVTKNLSPANIIPGIQGSILDAASLDHASLLYIPTGRTGSSVDFIYPDVVKSDFDGQSVKDGLNIKLKMTPHSSGQLADLLRAVGLKVEEPFDIAGQLPTNLFGSNLNDLLADVNLTATLPQMTFNKVGSASLEFTKRPVLSVVGTDSGLTTRIDTSMQVTLSSLNKSFSGDSTFATELAEGGGRQLTLSANLIGPGGRPASLDASMKLPGKPSDFALKFAGEMTLSSLLNVDIPVIGDLSLREVEKGKDFLVGKVSLQSAETTVGAFKLNGRWAIAISASGVKPAELIPGLSDLPIPNLALPDALFVYVPKFGSSGNSTLELPFDIAALPEKVGSALSGVLKPFGNGGSLLKPGLNLTSLLDVTKIPKLANLFKFTGTNSSKPFKLSGLLPVEALASLTKGGSKFSTMGKSALRSLVAQVDLKTELPAINLPGVRDIVLFRNPYLQIKGDGTDDNLKLAMDIKGGMRLSLPGVPPLDLDGNLAIAAAKNAIALDASGTGAAKGKQVTVQGRVVLNKENPQLQLAFISDVTVADLIGAELPGLSDLAFRDGRIGSEVISGTVQYRGAKTTLAVFDFKTDKRPYIALIPEEVDAANFIPGISGSPLDNAKLTRGALIYVPDGKKAYPSNDNYPPSLSDAIKLVSRNSSVLPTKGLKAAFDIEFKEGQPLFQALRFVGNKQTSMKLRGSLPVLMLKRSGGSRSLNFSGNIPKVNVNLPKFGKSGGGSGLVGAALDEAIRGVDLEATVPAINLPGINKVMVFGDPTFRIKGGDETDAAGNSTGKAKLLVGIKGAVTLKVPNHDLKFDGGFDIEKTRGGKSFKLALYSTTDLNWKKAFALPFLDLNQIGLAGAIERTADGKARLAASLRSNIKLGAQVFDSSASVGIASSGAPTIRFDIHNTINVSNLEGLKNIPGVKELSFSSLWVGTGGLGGRASIGKIGVSGEALVMRLGGDFMMLLRVDNLNMASLVKGVPEPLASLTLPHSVLALSTKSMENKTLADLPGDMQGIFKGILTGPDSSVPVFKGLGLIGAAGESDFPKQLRDEMNRIGVFDALTTPLVLAGGIEGVFGGTPKIALSARLPELNLPKGQPLAAVVSFDKVAADFFLRFDPLGREIKMGAGGMLKVRIPRLDDATKVDTLAFRGELSLSVESATAAVVKVAGTMKGTWGNPLGLNKFSITNPAFIIGVGPGAGAPVSATVEVGVGGTVGFAARNNQNLTYSGDFLFNGRVTMTGPAPIPTPLKLGLRLKGTKLGTIANIEIADALLRGVLTGPMAKVVVSALPNPAKKAAAQLQKDLKNEKITLMDLLQIDKVPLPFLTLRDVDLYFATPGAKIPGREETLSGMGVKVAGKAELVLLGKTTKLAAVDLGVTMTDGLVLKGELPDFDLGSNLLTLKNAKLDVVANLKQLPHFKLSGNVNVLGAKEAIDVEFSKDRVHFEFEKDLGRLIKTHFTAQTTRGGDKGKFKQTKKGTSVLEIREFEVTASTKTEIDDLITNDIFPKLGIPKIVGDAIKNSNPLFIHGVNFRGKLVQFVKGNPIALEIDHSFFGTRMKEPAIVTLVPAWSSKDPTKVIPAAAVAKAMTKSFYAYLVDNPVSLGQVNLGLISIEEAVLSASKAEGNQLKIHGRLNALGMPFSETTAIFDDRNGLTLDSTTEVALPLPLGALGTMGRSKVALHYELDPAGFSHKVDLKVSTAALGFEDNIHFNLSGNMSETSASFRSDNPCARFSSSTQLGAGDLRNFALKAGQLKATPLDFIHLIKFNPKISLPGPADAVKCGGRVLAIAGKAVDFAKQGVNEIGKLGANTFNIAGNVFNSILSGLKNLDCKLLKLGSCASRSDCRGNEHWNDDLKRCWVRGFQLARHYSKANSGKNWCMDIKGGKDRVGQEILAYKCSGKWNQAWRLRSDQLQNNKGGCIGVDTYRHGEKTKLHSCKDNSRSLYVTYRETGQISARLKGGSEKYCLAQEKGHVVLWGCGDVGATNTDLWLLYDPDTRQTLNPGGDRVKAIKLAAVRSPMSNDPPVPFLRYRNGRTAERYFTADPDEYGTGQKGYTYEGTIGNVFKKRAPGTVPLFRYWRSKGNKRNYYLTTSLKPVGDRFLLDRVAGYVYPNELAGTMPVYRYYEKHTDGHHYTANLNDLGTRPGGGWKYEGKAGFYVAKVQTPELPAYVKSNAMLLEGTPDVLVFKKRADGSVPVYKYTNRSNKNVLYTTNINEQGFGNPSFKYHGIIAYVFDKQIPGSVPIYRYYHSGQNQNSYTIDAKRLNAKKGKNGYKFETILGYATGPNFGPGKLDQITNAKPVPLLRYFNPSTNDHLYTADATQLGDGKNGYQRDGAAGSVFPSRVKDSVPLYRYWNGARKDHTFTTNFQEFWYSDKGYEYVGVEGFVYPAERKGHKPLHRYFNKQTLDSLLTTDFDEFNGRSGKDGFTYHRIEAWVPEVVSPGSEAKIESSTPEPFIRYRKAGNHRMVRGLDELGEGRDGFEFEHAVGMIFPKRGKGTVPLYHYFNKGNGDNHFTENFDELAFGKYDYDYLGIVGHVYAKKVGNSVALHRYYNPSSGDHLLTSDFEELNGTSGKDGYKHEGIVGWVPKFVPPGTDTPLESSKPVLLARYSNDVTKDHLMTAGLAELGDGTDGYKIENYLGYILPKRASGTIPLYRYFSEGRNDTLYTQNFSEFWYGKASYNYQGIAGYIYAEQTAGRVPLHRYFNRKRLDSVITTDFAQWNGTNGKDGYEYSSVLGSVATYHAPGTDTTIEASNPVPLVRYKNSKTGEHTLTAGSSLYGVKKGDISIQRAQGRIFTKRNKDTIPLYRYIDQSQGHHRFTTNFDEWLLSKGSIKYDGVVGYVYAKQSKGAVALHRYDNDAKSDTVLTVYHDEFGGAQGKDGYRYSGIVGWVPEYVEAPISNLANTYLATNKNFSCLESGDTHGSTLTSRLCANDTSFRFGFWSDGTIRNEAKNLCLGVSQIGKDRKSVDVGNCDYTQSQQWAVKWAGGSAPSKKAEGIIAQLKHVPSGKCLGLENASGMDGLDVDLHDCAVSGDNPQTWTISTTVPSPTLPGTDAPVQLSEPEWLARYVDPYTKSGDHMLTAGFDELGRGKNNYTPEVLLGRISTTKASQNMVPLYRYYNAQSGDHLLTLNFHELRFGASNYKYEGVFGYVFPTKQPGTVALHRYEHKNRGDNLLTTDFSEWRASSGRDGYSYLGTEGWVLDTGAEALEPWNNLYIANKDNMVCLNASDSGGLNSVRCEDNSNQRFYYWSDGTIRNAKGDLCFDASLKAGGNIRVAACDDNLSQKWEVQWQAGNWPTTADGKMSSRLVHWRSGQCVNLADGSGTDNVSAVMGACTKSTENDRQGTWWAHNEIPIFVAPGSDQSVEQSEPVPLISYVNSKVSSGDHMLTAGPEELGLSKLGYEMELAQGKIYTKRAQGTAPLYRYNNSKSGDHLYTREFRELGWGSLGYRYEGLAGYAYAEKQAEAVSLHRYSHPAKGDHYYTTKFDAAGGAGGKNGYTYEGIAAWIPEYPESPVPEFSKAYVATNKNLSCLDAEPKDGAALRSSFCNDHKQGQFSVWKDGTIRLDAKNLCLSVREKNAGRSSLTVERCDYTKDQQFDLNWTNAAPVNADGSSDLQIVHRISGQCVGLDDHSGQDGVGASVSKCEAAGENVQTWVLNKEQPVFIAPFMNVAIQYTQPIPFIRYFNEFQKDHLMQAGPEPFGLGKQGYEMQLAQGTIFTTRAEGSVPLYRYVDTANNNTLYTSNFHEFRHFKGKTVLDGVVGYVYPKAVSGATALHRYVNTSSGDHLVAGNLQEYEGKKGKAGYAYDGIIGYVPPYNETPMPEFQNIFVASNENLSCLDADGKDGGDLRSGYCGNADTNLKFSFWKDGTIRHANDNLCLSARKPQAEGAAVTLDRCDYTQTQQWAANWQSGTPNKADGKTRVNLTHSVSSKCIGLQDASGQDGVKASLFNCAQVERDVRSWVVDTKAPVFVPLGTDVAITKTGPVPFIRYFNTSLNDHSMQAGPEPYGLGKQGYEMQLAQGKIYKSHTAGTVPLYRYNDSDKNNTIYTSDFHEFRFFKGKIQLDGIVGYVHPVAGSNLVPLHRYVNAASGDQLISGNLEEYNGKSGKSGYSYDRIVGWVPLYDEAPIAALQSVFVATNKNLSCLDAADKEGSKLTSSFCAGSGALAFSFWKDGTVRHDIDNRCLSVRKARDQGAAIALARCDYTRDQQWTQKWLQGAAARADGKSSLALTHTDTGKCAGLRDASGLDGVEAAVFKCGKVERDVQTWAVHKKTPVFDLPGMKTIVKKTKEVPFVRYMKNQSGGAKHLMKAGPDEWGAAKNAYTIEKPFGTIFNQRDNQLQPLYRYVNDKTGTHFYANDFHEFRYVKNGFKFDDYVGYVFDNQKAGTIALHRYHKQSSSDYVLTTDFDEFGKRAGRNGYKYQRQVGWVLPYREVPIAPLEGTFVIAKNWMCISKTEVASPEKVVLNPCRDDNSMRLTFYDDNSIRNDVSGRCLTIANDKRSSSFQECSYKAPSQVFDVLWRGKEQPPKVSDGKRFFSVKHTQSKQCLTLEAEEATTGSELRLSKCSNSVSDTQSWKSLAEMPKAEPLPAWQSIHLMGGENLCLNRAARGKADRVVLQVCETGKSLKFGLYDDGSIRIAKTDQCLVIPEEGRGASAIEIADCSINSPKQTFALKWNGKAKAPKAPDSQRTLRIRHEHTNLCLGVRDGKWKSGKKAILRKCTGTKGHSAQNWTIFDIADSQK